MDDPVMNSLLERFLHLARSPDTQNLDAVECNDERWTYADLDTVSTCLAANIRKSYGERPTVAIISENHPYVLATILATWKIGGIVAPIDYHTPRDILIAMLLDIRPTCCLIPGTEEKTRRVVSELSVPFLDFVPEATTILALTQKYIDQVPSDTNFRYHPAPGDVAMYMHTSSASSISNIKCVPLTHANILAGSRARLQWWRKTWPKTDFQHLKVLGWSPWSHIIGISHDLGAAMLLTAGCYLFSLRPSSYHSNASIDLHEGSSLDVISHLLDTATKKSPTAFAGVPWILAGLMEKWKGGFKEAVVQVMSNFKIFGSGGAATSPACLNWCKELEIPLVIDIGMTELGGPLFHGTLSDTAGWPISDCLVPDAQLSLVSENGELAFDEGELHISSPVISKGYLRPNYSAFAIAANGCVTLRTGDIYQLVDGTRLIWKGRKEDFIQMTSGETLDPRVIEESLNRSVAVHRSCVVGDNFLRGASNVVCAILELSPDDTRGYHASLADVTREISSVNRSLVPPLRISWSRVLILNQNQHIPLTTKGAVFRKKLEQEFGEQLQSLLSRTEGQPQESTIRASQASRGGSRFTEDSVALLLEDILAEGLRIEKEVLKENHNATFAELGMDSSMATKIVTSLNSCFDLSFPLNTCHTYVDLESLLEAIYLELGLTTASTSPEPESTSSSIPPDSLEEVVIVGQALRLPGDINNAGEFWDALTQKREDIIGPIPEDRWDHASFYRGADSHPQERPCDITLDKAGFINITDFDHTFFGISSTEAYHVAPNIRLTLEIAFEALENANIPVSRIKGTDMGVFVAANMDEGHIKLLYSEKGWEAYSRFYGTGVATSTACGRLSYLLDVHGPSYTIDTACSSGLVAFDQAVRYLRSGEGDSAIVCGANTHSWPGNFGFLSAQKMTSPNSRCATFTDMADGYVPSEGAAAVVLKTKRAAIRDGDKILATVRSTATMHGGRSQGLVAPNVKAQIAMQRSLLKHANLDPAQVDFVEAHGTGTSLGDLIEIEGINEVFRSSHSLTRPLIVGAAKTCVGHTENVAGLIGLLKVVGSFFNSAVPGLMHLNANNMNPALDCAAVPLQIPWQTMPLLRNMVTNEPIRGMVLSNGFAGTISGAILEEPEIVHSHYPLDLLAVRAASSESSQGSSWISLWSEKTRSSPCVPSRTPSPISTPDTPDVLSDLVPVAPLFVVSAKSPVALEEYIKLYVDFCQRSPPDQFESICYTTCVGREHYRYRFACVAENMEDLIGQLKLRLDDKDKISKTNLRNVALAFPGQGSQYQGMARDLALRFPSFRCILTEAGAQASFLTGLPILSHLVDLSPPPGRDLSESDVAQVCIFVYQYSVSKWLQDLGLAPCAVLGHSLGEVAAAVLAGVFTFQAALEFVIKRASVLRPDVLHPAGMAAVGASPEGVNTYLDDLGLRDRLSIAVYNAEDSVVVSGGLEAIDTLISAVKQEGLKATKLDVNQEAFHSPYVAAAMPSLRKWLREREGSLASLKMAFYSSAYGHSIPKGTQLHVDYWVDHAQNPVLFLDAAKALALDSSIDVVLDLGPQPFVWTQFQKGTLASKPSFSIVEKRGKCQGTALTKAVGQLFQFGNEINLLKLFPDLPFGCTKVSLPTYPFQRLHNYPTFLPSRNEPLPDASKPKDQTRVMIPFPIDDALCETLNDHRIDGRRIVPGAVFAHFFASSATSGCLDELRFHQPLVADSPDDTVVGEVDGDAFVLRHGSSKICSGKISAQPLSVPRWTDDDRLPSRIVKKSTVYECFKNVQFGSSFRNIHEIKIWDDHADALISIAETMDPKQDRIRKLDACMHMFGAIAGITLPHLTAMDGTFLPSSLKNFALHNDALPSTFLVRYQLPVSIGRGAQVLSVEIAVYSLTGQPLLSCKNYSVAFIPSGVAVSRPIERQSKWMNNRWVSNPLPAHIDEPHKVDELLYLGVQADPPLLRLLRETASHTIFVQLPTSTPVYSSSSTVSGMFQGTKISVVVDVASHKTEPEPGSDAQLAVCHQLLSFFQLLMASEVHIESLLILSSESLHVTIPESLIKQNAGQRVLSSSIGSIVHGMLRVFKRESFLDSVCSSLDLPSLSSLPGETIRSIILNELAARKSGISHDGVVAYRHLSHVQHIAPSRFTPLLEPLEAVLTQSTFSGVAVIAGMGSIGLALASSLVDAGVESVVFLGRRDPATESIKNEFALMNPRLQARTSYRRLDITSKQQLETQLKEVQNKLGPIKHIIHTAAVMRDAAIPNISPASFDEVARPKVSGAWNLHVLSQELDLNLESFVLLSSTKYAFYVFRFYPDFITNAFPSVLVGNPGQLSYVAANSFLDYLAGLRRSLGLPGVSLQLGAWESRLTENLDMKKSFALKMSHQEGIPLILQAMSTSTNRGNCPVQVIAEFDVPKLLSVPAYASDPFFAPIFPKTPQPSSTPVATPAVPVQASGKVKKDTNATTISILRSVMELRPSETLGAFICFLPTEIFRVLTTLHSFD
ncbi:hypothetical protein H1R20_g11245, partial [Candolleomyces eurysporus]